MKHVSFDEQLKMLRNTSNLNTDIGDKFENLVINFLKKDTTYKKQYKKIKLFKYWSKRKSGDIGIDILAVDNDDGELVAIQCKGYADDATIDYSGLTKFVNACERYKINRLILAYTCNHISNNSQEIIKRKRILLLNKSKFRLSSIQNWNEDVHKITVKEPKKLRNDQKKVCDDVIKKFKIYDRGKIIMACGTGKTLTALKLTELMRCKIVLYLVPSISLIQQTMREWSDNTMGNHQYIAVCSDKSAGNDEDGQIYELEKLPSTDSKSFKEQFLRRKNYDMTVIFSTYQSIKTVMKGLNNAGYESLDLILCDEAHRTAVKLRDDNTNKISYFGLVHNNNNIRSKKRLYMTATPKIYRGNDDSKSYSMSDESIYGKNFSVISFYDAVHGKVPVLSDFKVKIAILPKDRMANYLGIIKTLADSNAKDDDVRKAKLLEHKAKIAAAWHGILHPEDEPYSKKALNKILVFNNTIEKSKVLAGEIENKQHGSFESIANEFNKKNHSKQKVSVRHIDGNDESFKRREYLDWLSRDDHITHTKIITNARCLSEGVDVPNLDGIIFMEPRRSTVDVVQSVGRVMRKASGKEFGYIILPVVVPGGTTAEDILQNDKFEHVWEILNALRSHDKRLIAELSIAGLVKKPKSKNGLGTSRITIDFLGIDPNKEKKLHSDLMLSMRTKLIKKVGNIKYVEKYGKTLGKYTKIVEQVIIHKDKTNSKINKKIEKFWIDMQIVINSNVKREDVIRMIADHAILKYVFDNLFSNEFLAQNSVSKKLDQMLKTMQFDNIYAELGDFYKDVNREIDIINNAPRDEIHEMRQELIKNIYNSYIVSSDPNSVMNSGVVYTPVELINFILHSVQHILKLKMHKSLNNDDIQILDPFAGTGTFLTNLIGSGLIDKSLNEKYAQGLYANELLLLAYYIATVNIETTFIQRMKFIGKKSNYVEFNNINYTDTFMQNPAEWNKTSSGLDPFLGDEHIENMKHAIERQNRQCIEIIIGNPPWGKINKKNIDDSISNYSLASRVHDTFSDKTSSQKNKLHEMYIHALRWSIDRLGKCGIIAFVINASFIRNKSFTGLRNALYDEFDEIWCYDLRGNQQDSKGMLVKKEGGKIFGSGSRQPVAIIILARYNKMTEHAIHYKDIGDNLSTSDKFKIIKKVKSIENIKDWKTIKPNKKGDWINQRNDLFLKFIPLTTNDSELSIFKEGYSGPSSGRAAWSYHSSYNILLKNMSSHIDYMNKKIDVIDNKEEFDETKAHWDTHLANTLRRHGKQTFSKTKILKFVYRPFFHQYGYFDRTYARQPGYMPYAFPKTNTKNLMLTIPTNYAGDFSVLAVDHETDLEVIHHAYFFPFYNYEDNMKIENISDNTLKYFIACYNDDDITKLDIFYYVYGVLHHPKYKLEFSNNLLVEKPRIPLLEKFNIICNAGRQLAELHINFENCDEYDLKLLKTIKEPSKIKLKSNAKHNEAELYVNNHKIFDDLPHINYKIDERTPLSWFVNRCTERSKASRISKIENNPLEHMSYTELISKIRKLVFIGTESDKIISKITGEFNLKNCTATIIPDDDYKLIDTQKKSKKSKKSKKLKYIIPNVKQDILQ